MDSGKKHLQIKDALPLNQSSFGCVLKRRNLKSSGLALNSHLSAPYLLRQGQLQFRPMFSLNTPKLTFDGPKITDEERLLENIAQPEEAVAIGEEQNLLFENVAFAIATLTSLLCIAALFLINLEYLLPEMARSQGLTLPYAHKLWLAPTSIIYLLASVAWTISHFRRNEI